MWGQYFHAWLLCIMYCLKYDMACHTAITLREYNWLYNDKTTLLYGIHCIFAATYWPHVGLMNLAIWVSIYQTKYKHLFLIKSFFGVQCFCWCNYIYSFIGHHPITSNSHTNTIHTQDLTLCDLFMPHRHSVHWFRPVTMMQAYIFKISLTYWKFSYIEHDKGQHFRAM